jgi:hypothetical protein
MILGIIILNAIIQLRRTLTTKRYSILTQVEDFTKYVFLQLRTHMDESPIIVTHFEILDCVAMCIKVSKIISLTRHAELR